MSSSQTLDDSLFFICLVGYILAVRAQTVNFPVTYFIERKYLLLDLLLIYKSGVNPEIFKLFYSVETLIEKVKKVA